MRGRALGLRGWRRLRWRRLWRRRGVRRRLNGEQTVDPRVKGTALRAAGLRPGPDGLPIDPRASACFERVRILSQDPAERGSPSWDCGTKALVAARPLAGSVIVFAGLARGWYE